MATNPPPGIILNNEYKNDLLRKRSSPWPVPQGHFTPLLPNLCLWVGDEAHFSKRIAGGNTTPDEVRFFHGNDSLSPRLMTSIEVHGYVTWWHETFKNFSSFFSLGNYPPIRIIKFVSKYYSERSILKFVEIG